MHEVWNAEVYLPKRSNIHMLDTLVWVRAVHQSPYIMWNEVNSGDSSSYLLDLYMLLLWPACVFWSMHRRGASSCDPWLPHAL